MNKPIEEIKELLTKISPWPWHVDGWFGKVCGIGINGDIVTEHKGNHVSVWQDEDILIAPCGLDDDELSHHNAHFIAQSPEIISQLLEQNEKYREALEYLVDVKWHKETKGKTDWYLENQPKAWDKAVDVLEDNQ